eukprot:scaffold234883_cov31-Tisochrysis_lutea.AAC.3
MTRLRSSTGVSSLALGISGSRWKKMTKRPKKSSTGSSLPNCEHGAGVGRWQRTGTHGRRFVAGGLVHAPAWIARVQKG